MGHDSVTFRHSLGIFGGDQTTVRFTYGNNTIEKWLADRFVDEFVARCANFTEYEANAGLRPCKISSSDGGEDTAAANQTFHHALSVHAAEQPNAVAIEDASVNPPLTLTYGILDEESSRFGGFLKQLGFPNNNLTKFVQFV